MSYYTYYDFYAKEHQRLINAMDRLRILKKVIAIQCQLHTNDQIIDAYAAFCKDNLHNEQVTEYVELYVSLRDDLQRFPFYQKELQQELERLKHKVAVWENHVDYPTCQDVMLLYHEAQVQYHAVCIAQIYIQRAVERLPELEMLL
jgi:hypothetical protein